MTILIHLLDIASFHQKIVFFLNHTHYASTVHCHNAEEQISKAVMLIQVITF